MPSFLPVGIAFLKWFNAVEISWICIFFEHGFEKNATKASEIKKYQRLEGISSGFENVLTSTSTYWEEAKRGENQN